MRNKTGISRRVFISSTALGSIAILGVPAMIQSPGARAENSAGEKELKSGITMRPYQNLCAICLIGEGTAKGVEFIHIPVVPAL